MRADPETRSAINEVLNKLGAAMETKSTAAAMTLFSNDPNMMSFGPAAQDTAIGQTQTKEWLDRFLAKADPVRFKFGYTTVKARGEVAWVDAHIMYTAKKGEEKKEFDINLSGVLEKTGDKWLWNQFHMSMPAEMTFPEPPKVEAVATAEPAKEAAPAPEVKPEEKKPEEPKPPEEPTFQPLWFDSAS
jgi:ketosteroid isomerase-like protein